MTQIAPSASLAYIVGEVLAELGRQRRSRAWLADQLGEETGWIYGRLKNTRRLTLVELERIAVVLDRPVGQFLPREWMPANGPNGR